MIWWIAVGFIAFFLFLIFNDVIWFDKADRTARKLLRKLNKPISKSEVDAARQTMENAELPMVSLSVKLRDNLEPLDTRLGGKPWVPDAENDWPSTDDGTPLCFLTQINFAQVPQTLDLPHQGLLQVFADIDLDQMSKDRHSQESLKRNQNISHVIRWYPHPSNGRVLSYPSGVGKVANQVSLLSQEPDEETLEAFDSDVSDEELLQNGWAVAMESTKTKPPALALAKPHCNLFYHDQAYARRVPKDEHAAQAIRRLHRKSRELQNQQEAHRIGGHPYLLSKQQKKEASKAGLDRVLLQIRFQLATKIRSDAYLILMIAQEDLRAGNIEKARFFWSEHT
ncbi:DUF1963 domain-containing protein [Loktanella sp. S4079]|uniref:DUF1963 domain-containing protein n=1 Tax=Loktanella sp. S4079 TaxID=579483 RepID=UPI000A8F9070|nr:DUF1963 domain-containing protein [Loktanella sp. S4079]